MNYKTEWDLPRYFYSNIDDPQLDIDLKEGLKDISTFFQSYKEKSISALSDEDFLIFLSEYDTETKLTKVWSYLSFLNSLNTQDQRIIKKEGELSVIFTNLANEGLFIDEEIKKIGAEVLIFRANLEKFKPYKNYLLNTAKGIQYSLDEPVERALNLSSQGGDMAIHSIYAELTSSFEFELEINGEVQNLTVDEVWAYKEHADPIIRRKATESINKIYGTRQNQIVFGNVYKGIVKSCIAGKKLRGFSTVMSSRNISEELSNETVDLLIETVRKSFPLYHKFLILKSKVLGKDIVEYVDIFAPISNVQKEMKFEEGLNLYLDIIKDFDKDFYDYSVEMFTSGRVDVFPRKDKVDGAYASYDKGTPSMVLLNYTNTFSDMMTITHELGHAIHGHLSQAQTGLCFGSPMSLAETASIFNETFVFEKIIEKGDFSKEEKINYLFARLSDIFSTTFRQIQYVIFERKIHEIFDAGKELTYPDFNEIWRETQIELVGKEVVFPVPANQEIGWSTIPHIFNTPFYCYSYAFGNLLSLSLYKIYKEKGNEFVEQYKNILRAGGSIPTEELLEQNGIPVNEKFFQSGIDVVENLLIELENEIKKND